jgi:tRNA(guanine-26,N2-N2) methyltransferase
MYRLLLNNLPYYTRYSNKILLKEMSSSIQIDKTLLPLNHVIIEEGSAYMIYDNKEEVFYNKVQVLNRDISIQVIKLFSEIYMKERNDKYQKRLLKIAAEQSSISPNHITSSSSSNHNQQQHNEDLIKPIAGIKILDALAATGLRSIRYMKEIPNIRSITINDLSKEATEVASNNIKINNIDENKCIIYNKDATILMYESRGQHDQYDVIDIDPYGSASPFLDAAVQAVTDGGLLCITCTDTSVLCGTYPEVCYSKYGSIPLRESYLHEGSLRILLNSIETVANKYKRYIEPWLSLSVDFYIRVFIRIYHSPHEVKLSCLKRIMIYQSLHCPTFYFENLISKRIVNKKLKTSHKHAHKELPKPQNSNDDDDKTNNCHDDHDYKHNGDAHSNKINKREISNNDFSFMHNKQSTLISNEIMNENGNFQGKVLNITSNCPDCGSKWRIGGPYWGQSMYNQEVIDELLKRVEGSVNIRNESGDSTTTTTTSTTSSTNYTHIPTGPRLAGILASMSEELKDVPMFYLLSELVSTIQTSVTPPYDDIKSAIENAGYRVSRFHHEPLAIKTDAPSTVVRLALHN